MKTIQDIAHAIRCAIRAGMAHYHKVRDIQRRRADLMRDLPF